MNLTYTKWLRLPIKKLPTLRRLFNVDGTENKSRALQYYMDLQVRTGATNTSLQFFLSNLGEHKAILEYPWFVATQPRIDWKRGWIDHSQLPVILKAHNAKKAIFVPQNKNVPRKPLPNQYYIGSVTIHPEQTNRTEDPHAIPKEYTHHKKVFSEKRSQRLPRHTIWDHAIELLPDAPPTLPTRLIPLNPKEREEMHKFVAEHLGRGTIRPSKSLYAASFFFIKKKDGKLCPVQDY
jgi:hypothetical protein